jgi:hypothetical protein
MRYHNNKIGGTQMFKAITNTVSALFEGVETLTEKSVKISSGTLDIVDVEVETVLVASRKTRDQKVALAVAEAEYELEKAKLKLKAKTSALRKLAENQETI